MNHRRLPPADHSARRQRLRDALPDHELDAILVTTTVNVRWLTGFTGSNAQLVLHAEHPDSDRVFTDGRYRDQIAEQAPDLTAVIERAQVFERVIEHASGSGANRLAFEGRTLDWLAAQRLRRLGADAALEVVATDGLVEDLRRAKDAHEIAALTVACSITDAAFADMFSWLAPGLTERDVALRLERTMVDLGAKGPAFETIVASGPNSAIPHHRPTSRSLGAGELVKIDAGAVHEGYHADMTRTVALGDPGQRLRAVHDLVREAQATGVCAVSAGTLCGEVDAACRDLISAAGHGQDFLHGTGHGVGLEIHEAPTLAAGSSTVLEEAFAVTVEPGVYLAGVGGVRIEDTVVVTDEQAHVLTTTPRELLVL